MKSRCFWERSTLRKFRIVFETDDFVLGQDSQNECRTFRKDTDLISFSERQVLEARLTEIQTETEVKDDKETILFYDFCNVTV